MDDHAPGGPLLIESTAEKEARERAAEQRQDRRQRRLQLWFNGALMVATVVSVGIVLYQNRILMLTLSEMVVQTSEIKKSAAASVDAAEAATTAARATENQLVIQLGQVDIAHDQLSAANKAASEQLTAQRDAMRLERRAWIGATQALGGPTVQIGRRIRATIQLINTGQTPALRVQSSNAMRPVERGQVFKPIFPPAAALPTSLAMLPGTPAPPRRQTAPRELQTRTDRPRRGGGTYLDK